MAKELPYFKFEPNQWENGNIQICSREDKGLFIDLCSMYWSRLGDVPLKLAINKLCAGNADAFKSLSEYKIITIENDFIRIEFLEEQLSEFDNASKQNSKNAKDGWKKRREQREESERNATASKLQSEIDAIREEKRIEEEKKQEEEQETKPPTPKGESIDFDILLETFNKIFGKHDRVVNKTVREKYKALLKEGYTKANIHTAMLNCKKDELHKKSNWKYCSIAYFSRTNTMDLHGTKLAPEPKGIIGTYTIHDHD